MVKESLIDVEPKHLTLVKKILKRHITYKTVWAYGSRVNWTANQYSDLDLVVFDANTVKLGELKEDFAESDLPFSVDVMSWEKIPESFKNKIRKEYVVLQKKPELEGWKECKLLNVAENFAMGPFGSNIKADNFVESGVPVIRGKNLNYHRYVDGDYVFLSDEKADQLKSSVCLPGDLVFTHRGTIGQVGLIPEGKYPRYVVSQSGMKLSAKKDILHNIFLFYFFKSNIGQHELLQNESQVGVPAISSPLTSLKSVNIFLPPLTEQKAIASVLSSLDDKIDLLHRQNKTLEAMAETLFRQWFVEEAKEDWKEVELEYVSQRITDGAHQSPRTIEDGMPMASVKDMHQWGINYNTCRKISKLDYQKLVRDDCRPLKNDILIAKDGSYLKHIFVIPEDMDLVILSSIAIIRPNGKYNPILLSILLKLDSTKVLLENIVTGAVIPRIVLKDFCKFKILLPPVSVQNKALESIESFVLKCWQNISQINTLEKLRNTLLPKLMSGEVGVEYGN